MSASVGRESLTQLRTKSDKAVYILISQVVSGRAQTSLERKIPLVMIKGVGLSTLRDDWLVRF